MRKIIVTSPDGAGTVREVSRREAERLITTGAAVWTIKGRRLKLTAAIPRSTLIIPVPKSQ